MGKWLGLVDPQLTGVCVCVSLSLSVPMSMPIWANVCFNAYIIVSVCAVPHPCSRWRRCPCDGACCWGWAWWRSRTGAPGPPAPSKSAEPCARTCWRWSTLHRRDTQLLRHTFPPLTQVISLHFSCRLFCFRLPSPHLKGLDISLPWVDICEALCFRKRCATTSFCVLLKKGLYKSNILWWYILLVTSQTALMKSMNWGTTDGTHVCAADLRPRPGRQIKRA